MTSRDYRQLLFHFEAGLADSLEFVPMIVRFNLDSCGIKLKLAEWLALSIAQRVKLIQTPCSTPDEIASYAANLKLLVTQYNNSPPATFKPEAKPEWIDASQIPDLILGRMDTNQLRRPSLEQWNALTPLQRYALMRLAKSHHEDSHFLPALREFGWA